MSGSGHRTASSVKTGDARIDGVLGANHWADAVVSYSFPTSNVEYGSNYAFGEATGMFRASTAISNTTGFTLDTAFGTAANDGFSVEGFTNLALQSTSLSGAHIRVAQTTKDPYGFGTAWSYYPSTATNGGDLWLSNVSFDYSSPRAGNYANLTVMHEIGHSLGLEHSHENSSFGTVPSAYDAMEYTVMSYRAYPGASTFGYTNESWGYAQSFMMLDIAALQQMYGADYTTNSGDTVYSWSPTSGVTKVNGGDAISPGGNRIFATIWDGGGNDTYDLSAFSTGVKVDLAPGAFSVFSSLQLAKLGTGTFAHGNIYNALQHKNDPRSLIENAKGGSGNDTLRGNQADNRLQGNDGDDTLVGLSGNDTLIAGNGRDTLLGGAGRDTLDGGGGNDALKGHGANDKLFGGANNDKMFGNNGKDRLFGQNGNDNLFGGNGDDTIKGGRGKDLIVGDGGKDILFGQGGNDVFRFNKASDSPANTGFDEIRDFTSGSDLLDLSRLANSTMTLSIDGAFSNAGPSVITQKSAGNILVLADLNGDGTADFKVQLDGLASIGAGDFIL